MQVTRLPHDFIASPNVEARRGDGTIRHLILHYTGMASADLARERLCAAEAKVSCHYLVDEAGLITQMVDEGLRAWHAGASSWRDDTDINSSSIGIEIHNVGHDGDYPGFPMAQMQMVAELCRDIIERHGILPHHVLAHSDIAPGRKIDPGEKFDWRWLSAQGIGHWVPPAPLSSGVFLQEGDGGDAVSALQGLLKLYGYGIGVSGRYGQRTRVVVEAFQRHFRTEKVDGVADHSTIATLHQLLRALPAISGTG